MAYFGVIVVNVEYGTFFVTRGARFQGIPHHRKIALLSLTIVSAV